MSNIVSQFQKRKTNGDPHGGNATPAKVGVEEVKTFLKENAAVKKLDGVAFEVKQRRQSGSSMARDTFIELALIVDKAMVRSLCLLDFFSTTTTKLDYVLQVAETDRMPRISGFLLFPRVFFAFRLEFSNPEAQ